MTNTNIPTDDAAPAVAVYPTIEGWSDVPTDFFLDCVKALAIEVATYNYVGVNDDSRADFLTLVSAVHKFCAAASGMQGAFDAGVQKGWALGKYTAADVPTVREIRKDKKVEVKDFNPFAKSKV